MLVVEGYMDVVALAQFDVGNAVATLGTATTPVHVAKLLRLADEIVFCFDGDAAGRKAAWRALEVSLPLAPDHKPIRFLFLPEGDDPDTYVRKHGKDGWLRKLREAETLSQFLLAQLRAECDLATAEGRARFISIAKPHVQKVTAPALRLQLINEIAQLARVAEGEIDRLLELPQRPRFSRPAPARRATPRRTARNGACSTACSAIFRSWSTSIPHAATLERPESKALLAIRDACREFDEEPSLGCFSRRLAGPTLP